MLGHFLVLDVLLLSAAPLILYRVLERLRAYWLTFRASSPTPVVARLLAPIVATYKYTEEEFYGVDGAPADVQAQRKAGLEALAAKFAALEGPKVLGSQAASWALPARCHHLSPNPRPRPWLGTRVGRASARYSLRGVCLLCHSPGGFGHPRAFDRFTPTPGPFHSCPDLRSAWPRPASPPGPQGLNRGNPDTWKSSGCRADAVSAGWPLRAGCMRTLPSSPTVVSCRPPALHAPTPPLHPHTPALP